MSVSDDLKHTGGPESTDDQMRAANPMTHNVPMSTGGGGPMSAVGTADHSRIEQFRKEMDALKLKGTSGSSERWMLVLGVLLGVAGVVLGIVGAVNTINAGDSPADQRAFMASGSLLGIVLVIAGTALFVRFSLGRYLRFWLIRLVYEGRADTDRIVDAIERASGIPPEEQAGMQTVAPEPRQVTPTAPGGSPLPPPTA